MDVDGREMPPAALKWSLCWKCTMIYGTICLSPKPIALHMCEHSPGAVCAVMTNDQTKTVWIQKKIKAKQTKPCAQVLSNRY